MNVFYVNPSDVFRFSIGQTITFTAKPRWYRRAWKWIRRYVFRRYYHGNGLVVTGIDYNNGFIQVESY